MQLARTRLLILPCDQFKRSRVRRGDENVEVKGQQSSRSRLVHYTACDIEQPASHRGSRHLIAKPTVNARAVDCRGNRKGADSRGFLETNLAGSRQPKRVKVHLTDLANTRRAAMMPGSRPVLGRAASSLYRHAHQGARLVTGGRCPAFGVCATRPSGRQML